MTVDSPTLPRLRIALCDDHAVVRAGYRRLLELEPGFEIVAEFADGDSAYAALAADPAAAPDVLVLDLSMPGRSGLDVLRRLALRLPDLRVLVFTMHDSAAMVGQCLRAGAAGFVTKSCAADELIDALRELAAGGRPVRAESAAGAAAVGLAGHRPPHLDLSPREFDVLRQLLDGRSVDQIARAICLAPKTVSNHQTVIRQKLGVVNSVEMVAYARAHGLLSG